MKVYVIASEMWCSLTSLNVFFIEYILFNNTAVGWHGKSSLDTYNEIKGVLETRVMPNMTESLSYDLGNFTEIWQNGLSNVTDPF